MHLPSSFLLVWTVIKDILKGVLQPYKPKQQTPLLAAVLLKETNTSKPAFFVVFYSLFTFSSFSLFPVFSCWRGSELFAIWPLREYFKKSFACDLVYAPDTYTKETLPSSHLNGGIDPSFLLPVFSSSSLYFPPLLCVWSELHIKAPRSLSSVQDAMRKVPRECNNSSSEHCLCIWLGYQNTASHGFFALFVVTIENNRRPPHWQLFGF